MTKSSNDIIDLQGLAKLVSDYREKSELVNNDKLFYDGYYQSIYSVYGIDKQKPKFPFGVILVAIILFLPAILLLFNQDQICLIIGIIGLIILLFLLILLLIYHIINTKKWHKTIKKIIRKKTEANEELTNIKNAIIAYKKLLPEDLIFQADEIYKDMLQKHINNIKDYFKYQNPTKKQVTFNIYNTSYYTLTQTENRICKYCGTTNKLDNINCKNCGANL